MLWWSFAKAFCHSGRLVPHIWGKSFSRNALCQSTYSRQKWRSRNETYLKYIALGVVCQPTPLWGCSQLWWWAFSVSLQGVDPSESVRLKETLLLWLVQASVGGAQIAKGLVIIFSLFLGNSSRLERVMIMFGKWPDIDQHRHKLTGLPIWNGTGLRSSKDEYWNNVVLGTLGNTLEPADMITGLRLVDWALGEFLV